MRRAGGWVLGAIVVATMAGGGGLALKRVYSREIATVLYLRSDNTRGPTRDAIWRGAQYALGEAMARAGRFRVRLEASDPGGVASPDVAVWIGTTEAIAKQGKTQPTPFHVSALNTHPFDPTGHYGVIPDYPHQGRAAAQWSKSSKLQRIFLLRDVSSAYSEAISSAFLSAAGNELIVEGPVDPLIGREALYRRILDFRPDLVFYAGEEAPYSTTREVFTAFREKGYVGKLSTADADPEVSFLVAPGRLVEGVFLISPFAPAPAEFDAGYARLMGVRPGPHVTCGYFAMKAALDLLDRADSLKPDDLQRAAAASPFFIRDSTTERPCALYVARNGKFEFVQELK
ncbi:MAG TPA: ABC transporter substrate-binding protein [Planctomycetota bacterium]|nr:ABC transporter substrate-binding protein [Planctomycetota bacterium]